MRMSPITIERKIPETIRPINNREWDGGMIETKTTID